VEEEVINDTIAFLLLVGVIIGVVFGLGTVVGLATRHHEATCERATIVDIGGCTENGCGVRFDDETTGVILYPVKGARVCKN
jgi:hypothetical protein